MYLCKFGQNPPTGIEKLCRGSAPKPICPPPSVSGYNLDQWFRKRCIRRLLTTGEDQSQAYSSGDRKILLNLFIYFCLGPKKYLCFRLHEILKVGKLFHFVKSIYMGKMGKQDGRPGKSLGNRLNMLKTLGSGAKN